MEAIEAWLPLFLFSILFGLSMDYHVFLLTRIREEYDKTRDNTEAVAYGLRTTGGIITGAALIMVAVFSGFAAGRLVLAAADGLRPGGRGLHGCDDRPVDPRAGVDASARRPELVPAEVAGVAPEAGRRGARAGASSLCSRSPTAGGADRADESDRAVEGSPCPSTAVDRVPIVDEREALREALGPGRRVDVRVRLEPADDVRRDAAAIESLGYPAIWVPEGMTLARGVRHLAAAALLHRADHRRAPASRTSGPATRP